MQGVDSKAFTPLTPPSNPFKSLSHTLPTPCHELSIINNDNIKYNHSK